MPGQSELINNCERCGKEAPTKRCSIHDHLFAYLCDECTQMWLRMNIAYFDNESVWFVKKAVPNNLQSEWHEYEVKDACGRVDAGSEKSSKYI